MASADPSGLEAELEGALLDAMAADPYGPALVGRLKTVARGILLRHGLGAARIEIAQDARGAVVVHVALPPGQSRVKQVVLYLDTI